MRAFAGTSAARRSLRPPRRSSGRRPISLKLECLQLTRLVQGPRRLPQSPDPAGARGRLRDGVGRQPWRRRRLRRSKARHPGARLRAGNRNTRQDCEDQGLWSRGHHRRRVLRRSAGALRPICRGERRAACPSLRRGRDHRGPGHAGAGVGGGPRTTRAPKARHRSHRGRRRRAHRRGGRLVRWPGQSGWRRA